MSAKDQIAQMLNELMGPGRNEEKNLNLNFRDPDVCKFFLAGFCPHDEFTNTKADLGSCKYLHDENLRIAYRKSEHFGKLGYERQFLQFLERVHSDMMRKIERNKDRLNLTQAGQNMDEETRRELEAKADGFEQEMTKYVEKAEQAGSRGDLDKSQKYVKLAEDVNTELEKVRKLLAPPEEQEHYTAGYKDPQAPKPMRVCEVCGSFLIIGDVQQRIDDHMKGKQHLGYLKIAETLQELKEKFRKDSTPERRSTHSRSKSPHIRERARSSHASSAAAAVKGQRASRDEEERRRNINKKSRSRSRDRHNGGGGGHRRHASRSRSPHFSSAKRGRR